MTTTTSIGIVGGGWRADFFARLGSALTEHFTVVGAVVRRSAAAEPLAQRWGVPVYTSPAELIVRQHPDLVICAVPRTVNAGLVRELVSLGAKVLCETPPADDVDGLRALWSELGAATGSVQVAEQYLLMPLHAARHRLVEEGLIGRPTSVHVSSTHDYHAVSLIRGLLGVGFDPATVRAQAFTAPLVDPKDRDGWSLDDSAKAARTVLATLDFGDGRSGLYDFTDNQWHNPLRSRRLLIRGSHGEINDSSVVRLVDNKTIVTSEITRSLFGHDLNLDGFDTEQLAYEGRVVYRNLFLGHRLMDEEIAIASIMLAAGLWARDMGPAPYSLAQACQDHLVSLAIGEAAISGRPVTTSSEPWSES